MGTNHYAIICAFVLVVTKQLPLPLHAQRVLSIRLWETRFIPFVEVGFKYKETDYGTGDPKFHFNTLRMGNRNTGHTYYGDYFEKEKNKKKFEALMEYLKSL